MHLVIRHNLFWALYPAKSKLLKAIKELHKAKINWFADETLLGSILSMLYISDCYSELGLAFAAKYYALAAAFTNLSSPQTEIKRYIPRALIRAAECDFVAGSWVGYLELIDIGLNSLLHFTNGNIHEHLNEEFNGLLLSTTSILYLSQRFGSDLHDFVRQMLPDWLLTEYIQESLQLAERTWRNRDLDDLWRSLEDQLWGRPFGDLGQRRTVIWSELGVTWKICWANNYEATYLGEYFIATLQILLADLAGIDLFLLQTNVEIDFSVSDTEEFIINPIPSNTGRKWELKIPNIDRTTVQEVQAYNSRVLASATAILSEISLLPLDRFEQLLTDRFQEGLTSKVFIANSFSHIFKMFIAQDQWSSSQRATKTPFVVNRDFRIKAHRELKWIDGPIRDGLRQEVLEHVGNRYRRFLIPIQYTLRRLKRIPQFLETVNALRREGWKDWHILLTVANITISYRVFRLPEANILPQLAADLMVQMMNEREKETWSEVTLTEFSEENLRLKHKPMMISTLKILGLECRQMTPDLDAIDNFLRRRCYYWDTDVEHPDPFLND